jgi:hypothetical protein
MRIIHRLQRPFSDSHRRRYSQIAAGTTDRDQVLYGALPLDLSPPEVCTDECRGCSIKLLEYIAMELESWECRLDDGDIPNFGDLKKLARSSNKIYLALLKNGLVGS